MATPISITIDCTDSARLLRFWVAALHYEVAQPPDGSATWADFWRPAGMPEEELAEFDEDGGGYDLIVDPDGVGPRIWFQPVPEGKVVKNRVHLDLNVSGGRTEAGRGAKAVGGQRGRAGSSHWARPSSRCSAPRAWTTTAS